MDERPRPAARRSTGLSSRGRPLLRVALGAYAAACLSITIAATTGLAAPLLDLVRSLPGGDLTGHFLLVGGLSLVSVTALIDPDEERRGRRWLRVVTVLAAAVTLDELLQSLFPRRSFSPSDLAANLLAVLVFSTLALGLRRAGADAR